MSKIHPFYAEHTENTVLKVKTNCKYFVIKN